MLALVLSPLRVVSQPAANSQQRSCHRATCTSTWSSSAATMRVGCF